MNNNKDLQAELVKKLYEQKVANYRASGDPHPEVAAQYAVDGLMPNIMAQPAHIVQLLEEEIEDAVKAGKQIAEKPKTTVRKCCLCGSPPASWDINVCSDAFCGARTRVYVL